MPTDLSVNGSALGESVQCLVATGAAISVVSYEFLQKTPAGRKLTLTDSPVKSVNMVSGKQLIVMGQESLPIKIQSNPYECDAHVISNLGYDVVQGRDFLRKTKAVINLGEHTLYLQPSQDTPTPADAQHSVKALATHVIPPRSETIIPGKIPDATADSQGIMEAIPRLVERYNSMAQLYWPPFHPATGSKSHSTQSGPNTADCGFEQFQPDRWATILTNCAPQWVSGHFCIQPRRVGAHLNHSPRDRHRRKPPDPSSPLSCSAGTTRSHRLPHSRHAGYHPTVYKSLERPRHACKEER